MTRMFGLLPVVGTAGYSADPRNRMYPYVWCPPRATARHISLLVALSNEHVYDLAPFSSATRALQEFMGDSQRLRDALLLYVGPMEGRPSHLPRLMGEEAIVGDHIVVLANPYYTATDPETDTPRPMIFDLGFLPGAGVVIEPYSAPEEEWDHLLQECKRSVS